MLLKKKNPPSHVLIRKTTAISSSSLTLSPRGSRPLDLTTTTILQLAPVVQILDNVVQRINHYPVNKYHQNLPSHSLNNKLSSAWINAIQPFKIRGLFYTSRYLFNAMDKCLFYTRGCLFYTIDKCYPTF